MWLFGQLCINFSSKWEEDLTQQSEPVAYVKANTTKTHMKDLPKALRQQKQNKTKNNNEKKAGRGGREQQNRNTY